MFLTLSLALGQVSPAMNTRFEILAEGAAIEKHRDEVKANEGLADVLCRKTFMLRHQLLIKLAPSKMNFKCSK